MAVTTTQINKPLNPRGNDQSPLAFNRAKLYSGKALDFDGTNDKVTVSDNAAIDFGTSDFSIVFIMESSAAGNARVLDKRNTSSGYTLYINSSKQLVLELNDTTGNTGFTTSTIYADGELKHVVVSADRDGNASFYINGALDETIDISSKSGNIDSTSDLFLGADAPSGTSIFYDGKLSGLKMYSTALTAAQVANLYNNPEKIVPTGVANSALKLWLPMQEGAGTTAYDGSGNGNHGTISGATWTHGIGAPVSQTAVIDWNKGTNLLLQSNAFDTTWVNASSSETAGQSGYDGSLDAWKIDITGAGGRIYQSVSQSGVSTYSIYAKAGSLNFIILSSNLADASFDLSNGLKGTLVNGVSSSIESIGGGWYRCSLVVNGSLTQVRVYPSNADNNFTSTSGNIYIQNAQLESASTAGPFVLTLTTAQSSEVLIPKGITSGRDLFYNLFAYARKQSALNLDGNSWAEIHDNASLDFGTGAFTLEAWVKKNYINSGSSLNIIMSLGDSASSSNSTALTVNSTNVAFKYVGYQTHNVTTGDWVHVVGVYDETNAILYVDGVAETTTARNAINITNALTKYIGRDSTTTRNYADQIAQPRIYNRALTADEVQKNYEAGKNTYS